MWNWNPLPTFVPSRVSRVLIEPVWNWNPEPIKLSKKTTLSFDWTSVELKQIRKFNFTCNFNRFDWTSVELKLILCCFKISHTWTFWLNQCGIETIFWFSVYKWCYYLFWLNHPGIEMHNKRLKKRLLLTLIKRFRVINITLVLIFTFSIFPHLLTTLNLLSIKS